MLFNPLPTVYVCGVHVGVDGCSGVVGVDGVVGGVGVCGVEGVVDGVVGL